MNVKNIVTTVIITGMTLGFSACSNDGSTEAASTVNIPIDVNCISSASATEIETYITTQSGDTIVKDEDNTTVSIVLDANAVKRICLESGSAHIVR